MISEDTATVVVNLRYEAYDVYIGRGSIWGNPFTHKQGTKAEKIVGTRQEAISLFKNYLLSRPDLLDQIENLRGKRLGCYCKPHECHGDILIEILDKLKNQKSEIEEEVFW